MSYAHINNQEIFFQDSENKKPPIIMLHGFLMDHYLFDHQVSALMPNYRCIRFDARAFGQTKWDEKSFNLYDTVNDCIGLMNHLEIENAVICGMSQGGYAALRMAIKHPTRVKALVLMNTQAGIDDEATKAQYCQLRDTWCEFGPLDPLINGLASVLLGAPDAPEMKAHWQAWLPKWKNYSKNAIFHGMNNLLQRDDISSQLYLIKQPTLITHGEQDLGMPISNGHYLRDHLENCREFIAIPKAAHVANYTHPELVNNAMMRFLNSLS